MRTEKRNQLKILSKESLKIEEEIAYIHDELMKPTGKDNKPVGVKGNLIDREGFPRADIDIHQIRILRNRYACLQTDHKELMKKIEGLLKEVMALPFDGKADTPIKRVLEQAPPAELVPILQIDAVDSKSPAEAAGLEVGDLILKFGSLMYDKRKSKSDVLAEVVRVVGQNLNEKVAVIIERNLEELEIVLVPAEWDGRGFLGCKLVPI